MTSRFCKCLQHWRVLHSIGVVDKMEVELKSVSIPLFCATGNRNKAFVYSFLFGTSEPVGAIIGFLIRMWYTHQKKSTMNLYAF